MAKSNACGYVFEREVKQSLVKCESFVRKIPTVAYRSVGNELFDIFSVKNGQAIALELKATKSHFTSFRFNLIQPHQVIALLEFHKNGGFAYILINVKEAKNNRVYILSIVKYIKLLEESNKLNRKSVPIKEFELVPNIQKTGKPSMWEFSMLFSREFYNK